MENLIEWLNKYVDPFVPIIIAALLGWLGYEVFRLLEVVSVLLLTAS